MPEELVFINPPRPKGGNVPVPNPEGVVPAALMGGPVPVPSDTEGGAVPSAKHGARARFLS